MSTSELSGSWIYRSFNPTFVTGDHFIARNIQVFTEDRRELGLIRAEAVFNLQVTGTTLAGTIEWPGPPPGGLDLTGTVPPEPISFDIVGTGRPDSDTAGWEYHYHGHLTRHWPNGVDQRPALVGSVFRAKSHNGVPISSPAGEVFSFIAVKQQPPFTWELSGLWTYRSFLNDREYFWEYKVGPQNLGELILQEAVFKLETPTSTTLRGTTARGGADDPLALDLREGTVQPGIGGEPASFDIKGFGRPGTDAAGCEFHYHGHLTRHWLNGVDQRPALVGSVIWAKPQVFRDGSVAAPAGYVAPFIAVKQPPSR